MGPDLTAPAEKPIEELLALPPVQELPGGAYQIGATSDRVEIARLLHYRDRRAWASGDPVVGAELRRLLDVCARGECSDHN